MTKLFQAPVYANPFTRARSWAKKLGPGLITGAADDDPSGIATYSQAGAQLGLNVLWTMFLTYPLMVGIQIVSARIGRVTGKGLSGNIRAHFPGWLLYTLVGLLLVANTINIAADLSAMGEALGLLIGGPTRWYAAVFGLICMTLQTFIPYGRYVRILTWLTLALLTYVGVIFSVHISWMHVGTSIVAPQLTWNAATITTLVAVFGTTISPYLFFWQASQEVEEIDADPKRQPLMIAPEQVRVSFRRIKIDTCLGMGFSNLVAFFIILTTAVTLHAYGIVNIQTSADAATALRPIAGEFAFLLFAAGIVGTGFLAVPVLAGSTAYAMAGAFGWTKGLRHKPAMAKRFYAIIGASTLVGVGLGFSAIDPIKSLYWSAVINGVISVPIMVVMMLMGTSSKVMGRFAISGRLTWLGWLATAVMAVAVIAMFVTFDYSMAS